MSDLIDRQAAIVALKKAYWDRIIQSAKDDPCIVDAMTDWAIRQIKALPSVQPESAIPLSWIERQIEWMKSLDNAFATLTAGQISAMVNKWKDEQNE